MYFPDEDEESEFPLPAEVLPPLPQPHGQSRTEPVKGSGSRYSARVKLFEADGLPGPKVRHLGLWLLHNVVAHPLLGLFPNQKTVEIHELTSAWLNHDDHPFERARRILHAKVPKIPDRAAWILHNCVSHVAIGLVPSDATFALHDATAEAMGVPGWV